MLGAVLVLVLVDASENGLCCKAQEEIHVHTFCTGLRALLSQLKGRKHVREQ